MGKETELAPKNEVGIQNFKVIEDPVKRAELLLSENKNPSVALPSFNFVDLEDEIRANPTIILKTEAKLRKAVEEKDIEAINEHTKKLGQYRRRRCLVIKAGEALYQFDETQPAKMKRYVNFLDTTTGEMFVMRQKVAVSSFDILNRDSFELAKSDPNNTLGITKDSQYDESILYSNHIVVDISFLGIKKGKNSTDYHVITLQRSIL